MEDQKFLAVIRKILELEALDSPRYAAEIEQISMDEIRRQTLSNISVNHELYKYLDDFDIRRKDENYKQYQTGLVTEILSNLDKASS